MPEALGQGEGEGEVSRSHGLTLRNVRGAPWRRPAEPESETEAWCEGAQARLELKFRAQALSSPPPKRASGFKAFPTTPQEEKPSALVADGLLFSVSQEDKAVCD